MRQYWIAATLCLVGCAVIQPITGSSTLILKPQISGMVYTQAEVPVYATASINHLVVTLFPLQDAVEQAAVASSTLNNAQLDNPVVFSSLKANTTYRAKSQAYLTADNSQLISTQDSNSYTDIQVLSDDRPTVGTLKVKLIDRAFNGVATSSLAITNGGYLPVGAETMKKVGLEGIVTVFAGTGATGSVDAYRTASTFLLPRYSAFDGAGNMYVSEWSGNRIRKIAPDGMVTTVAGNGTAGTADGQGSLATFQAPGQVAIAPNNDLYLGDFYNQRIRKITAGGLVSTFAGSGVTGLANGVGTSASFNGPGCTVMDASGNLYLGDFYNNVIRKVTPSGVVSTFAGCGSAAFAEGNGTNAAFNWIHQIAFDLHGNLLVADALNHRIRSITPAGQVSTIAGNGATACVDGSALYASFKEPTGVAVDARGTIYVADRAANRIRVIVNGMVTTLAGNGSANVVEGTGYAASLYSPDGLSVDANGNLYVGSWQDHRILRVQ